MITSTISPNSFDYDIEQLSNYLDMSNKLVCTFSTEDTLEGTLSTIQDRYKIIYNKIFILYAKSQEEFVITYNVDLDNVSNFIPNTVLVHRKKESNTLYTIILRYNCFSKFLCFRNCSIIHRIKSICWS